MTTTERLTLLALATLLGEKGRARTPDLAKHLGKSRRTTWRRLTKMARKGWVTARLAVFPQTFAVVAYWDFTDKGRRAARGVGVDVPT